MEDIERIARYNMWRENGRTGWVKWVKEGEVGGKGSMKNRMTTNFGKEVFFNFKH